MSYDRVRAGVSAGVGLDARPEQALLGGGLGPDLDVGQVRVGAPRIDEERCDHAAFPGKATTARTRMPPNRAPAIR
jgi:hypothetical protein